MDEGTMVSLEGSLAPKDFDGLPPRATLDFSRVESVSFSALRALLALQQVEHGIDIVNASDDVYLLFDSTGVRTRIPVGRAPHEFDLGGFHVAGDGNLGECYFDDSGDRMVKLYTDPYLLAIARREKLGAYAAFVSGVPTPFVGDEVTVGDRRGVVFERARNKRSISRLIADEPERIEEHVKTFADVCLQLHATPCAKDLAPSKKDVVRGEVLASPVLSPDERERVVRFLGTVEDADTCLHGDLQIGNVIVSDVGPQLIDMGDFSYGNPLFDLGMTYFVLDVGTRTPMGAQATMKDYHITVETAREAWKIFARDYFGADTPGKLEEVQEMLMPFVGFRMVTFSLMAADRYGEQAVKLVRGMIEEMLLSHI